MARMRVAVRDPRAVYVGTLMRSSACARCVSLFAFEELKAAFFFIIMARYMRPPNTSLFIRNISDDSRKCKDIQFWRPSLQRIFKRADVE
ncbi:hypothetical protein G5714_015607 [Onychostoma macrolepis]|uniref:Uncharacterized protein n=1 Tax=Onychostoma macrolepis TaxID=369639 RepID=A0A7J6C6T2_9TELE|nr:hypothetical protein G5714_015607 [Onychostoma macrolepis]